jgi:hypothetical protein
MRIICTLTGHDLAEQAARWRRLRASAAVERRPTADGLRVTFRDDPSVEAELRALVAVENECCGWASWQVTRDEGGLVMHARSTGHGIATLHGMMID